MSERGDVLAVVFIVGFDNFLNKPVPHDIFRVEMAEANTFDAFENLSGLNKSRTLPFREVDLSRVSCDDGS